MKYDVYVQGNLIKTVESESTGQVLNSITIEIHNETISIDKSKPHEIKIVPHNTTEERA